MTDNPRFSALCADLALKAGLVAGFSTGIRNLPDEDVANLRQAFVSLQLILSVQGYEHATPQQAAE